MSTPRRETGLVPLVAATAPEKSAEALAARHGAAGGRPALAHQIVFRRQVRNGEVSWVVKNPETMKYYNFEDSEWGLIELFDGTRTREEILEEYNARFPKSVTPMTLILDYEDTLRRMGLIEQSVAERNLALLAGARTARQRAAQEKAEGFNPFFILFHVFDPDLLLNRTVKYVRWIWTPPIAAVWVALALWTIGVFVGHWGPIWTGTYELYAFLRKPFLDIVQFFFLLSFIGFIHEMSHAYATKIYGGEVHDIGVALLYFTPAFYCDTTDSLLFPNKWQAFWVTTAGIYTEGFLCSFATILWVVSYPDTLVNEVAYKTMLFTGVSTVFFNINPLVKIDGYYALSSVLDMPELREESFRFIGANFQKTVLRLPVEVPAASRRKRTIYWIFGTLALAYTAVIMRFIGGIFYNFYERLLPDFAIVLLLLTLYRIFRKRVRLATQTAHLLYLDKKELLMALRTQQKMVAAGAAILILVLVPWTRRTISVEAPLRPARVAHVEAPEDAVVRAVFAREGDSVIEGGTLLSLSSPLAEADRDRAAGEEARLQKATSAARDEAIPSKVFQTEGRWRAAEIVARGEESRLGLLTVKSPIAGRVLTSRVEDLEKRFVTEATPLIEVGDCRTLVADLPVSERLIGDVSIGAEVRGLVRQRSLWPIHGTVVSISSATADQPGTVTGLVEPGAPPSKPERLLARASFDNPDGQLKPGAVVRAKIYGRRASYVARAWRVVRRWFKSVAW